MRLESSPTAIFATLFAVAPANVLELTVENISEGLRDRAELIDQRFLWSTNKRVASGWFFKQQEGKYIVAYSPKGEYLEFTRKVTACAEYIVREVETIMR